MFQEVEILVSSSSFNYLKLKTFSKCSQVELFLEEEGHSMTCDEIAAALAQKAFNISQSRTIQTPFGDQARANRALHIGGKPDDITCVVGRVNARADAT